MSSKSDAPQASAPRAPEQMQVPVDETHIVAHYANFCRVTGTPEELIVDFGLNKQVGGTTPETIQLTQQLSSTFSQPNVLLRHLRWQSTVTSRLLVCLRPTFSDESFHKSLEPPTTESLGGDPL